MASQNHTANVIGAQMRKLRVQQELTQDMLAARCGVVGWNLSRGTLAKIEAGVRCVTDFELWVLARALRCPVEKLYPASHAEMLEAISRHE